jgi:hypothetical protein
MEPVTSNDEVVSDEELTALALAADPDIAVPDDAVSFWDGTPATTASLLPSWYMPAPAPPRHIVGWRRNAVRVTVGLVVASFLMIEAYGLCNTYGDLKL